jgi:cytochrome c oxidase subunit I+III
MFAAGLAVHWMHVFSAASMVVVLPSGMQVFAWLATIRRGRLRLTTPTLFVLGFFFVFTIGGLTGVMLAVLPFDWQAHDTHFVVAHLHYVLIGGMLFPLLAGLYYWAPTVSGHGMSDRLGRWVCGLLFAGVNVAFLPMHLTGLLGMPRRVYTYPAGLGWEWPNLVSTAGAALIAVAMLLLAIDLARHVRPAHSVDVDPWRAPTLEWLPLGPYGPRSIPRVESRHPLWDQPGLREEVAAGAHYLPGTITGGRETLVTSPRAARPQYVAVLPGDGWPPFLAAIATAAFFVLLTVAQPLPAAAAGAFALAMILAWVWQTDRGPGSGPADVGGGLRLPLGASGPTSHAWWAMGVLLIVAATSFASLVFSCVYLARGAQDGWPPAGQSLPAWGWPAAATAAWAAVSAALAAASRALGGVRATWFRALVSVAALVALAAVGLEVAGQWRAGLAPGRHAYGATVAAVASVQAFSTVVVVVMAAYSLVRSWCGRLDRGRRLTFDMTMLAGHYVAAQGIAGLAVVHLGPRLFG